VCLKFTLAVTINMSAYSVTNRVFSILSILTNQWRQAFIPSNMPSHPQQELDTQDEIPSLPTTQDSPATSMAKLSTCSNERNEVRNFLFFLPCRSYYKRITLSCIQLDEVYSTCTTCSNIFRYVTWHRGTFSTAKYLFSIHSQSYISITF
jgi:hypothetical protein